MKAVIQLFGRIGRGSLGCFPMAIVLFTTPALGQDANFGKLALSSTNPSGTMKGSTGGSTSLPAIISNTDLHNNRCLGFGDPKPDHLLILQQGFPNLTIQVRSNTDTTLVVKGPDGVVRCSDDAGTNKDAGITDTNWKAGTYRIWVGTAAPGLQRDYTLSVQP